MYKSFRTFISIFLCIMLSISVMPLAFAADDTSVEDSVVEYDNISIGAGGSFFQPIINPIDSSQYIVTCDMGGIYSTDSAGEQWVRTNICRINASCISDDGVYFAGSYGLYASYDNGQTMKLIYPREEIVQYTINRLGRDNPLMIADGYDNGFVIAVNTFEEYVYFITMDWNSSGTIRICRSLFDGTDLEIWSVSAPVASPLNVTYRMESDGNTIIYSDGSSIWSFDILTSELTEIYTAEGSIVDMEKIGENYFILDDTEDVTNVIYTTDFISFNDLNDFNTLTNEFRWGGVDRTLEWHYNDISGNGFDNIWLAFYSPVAGISDIGGVLKFDGASFTWAYDQVFTTRSIGWTGGGIAPIYGICADPNDNNHCIMTNIDTVYDIYFDSETLTRNVNTLHCIDHENGYYQTTGLDCQTTYFVREDPFDSQHIIICTTDLGLQISYDGGISFRRHEVLSDFIDNTCYDLYFDEETEGLVYGIWSSRHDAPYTPKLSDANAEGGFAVSYDGGITWSFDYSTGIPENSIPVRMSVIPNGEELMIAVATFNNGFYVSYDTGKTFTAINDGMNPYNGMIFGEDVVITDEYIYCLTASHNFDGLTPSALYQYNRNTAEIVSIDMGDIVLANSMTYDERYGLYVSVTPYYSREWIDEISKSYWVNYGGGVYVLNDTSLELIFESDTGAYNTAFTAAGTMYVTDIYGELYIYENDEFRIYADNLFHRLKNISFSNDYETIYITTLGGGTYRMPVLETTSTATEYTVTFVNYDGTILSTQTVVEGESAVLPENPTRESDEHYHYTFAGWSTSSDYITSDLTVTARYVYKAHTTTTKNASDATCTENGYTGDVCCSSCGYIVSSGEIIPAAGHTDGTVSENGDDTHTVYCGVCNDVIRTENCTDSDSDGYCDECGYKFKVYYTVIFADWDGSILSEQTILEGESAVVPDDPTRASDEEGSYTFAGWDNDVSEIQSDMTVTALYTFTAHTEEVRGAFDATCTSEGYTGDIYCSECDMLLESGSVISMTVHSSGDTISNEDGTHSFSCTVCETVISTESCADNDSDGYCDECEYAMNVTTFTSVSSFTNGKQYLITGSGYALRSTITAESVTMRESNGYYVTADEIPDDMLWTYQNGYLYTTYNGQTYYLSAYRGINSSYTLSTSTSSWWASTWNYNNGSLTTQIFEWRYRITKYLNINKGTVTLSSSGSITLYQLEN